MAAGGRADTSPRRAALSLFLVAAASRLSEEALTGEASKAAAGDVHGRAVGGHAKEFVQFTDPERLIGLGVEGIQDGPVGGGRLGRSSSWIRWSSPSWRHSVK